MTNAYKLYTALFFACAVILCASSALFAYADNTHAPAKYIIVFENGAYQDKAEQDKLIASVGGKVTLPLAFMNAVAVEVPEKAAAQILAHKPGVASVHEDLEMTLLKRPAPAPTGEVMDWGVTKINADDVWSTTRGDSINVAVLDTGIDFDHPDLDANVGDAVNGGVSFVPLEAWYVDGNGHGTHVSGTIAAVDNTIGVVGVANMANLYGVQVLNKRGSGSASALVSGIQWAIDNDMDVITMSIGFPIGTTLEDIYGLKEVLDKAEAAGIVVVAAAGNDGLNNITYPAAYDTVIAVAATNKDDSKATYSNYGVGVDVAAPGTEIQSTWTGGTYKTISGTSMATPHVTGVVALLLEKGVTDADDNGVVNNYDVRKIIAKSIVPITGPSTYSFGRIDAKKVLGLPVTTN